MITVGRWLSAVGRDHRLEGELLLAHHLNLSRANIIAHPEHEIPASCRSDLDQSASRLAAGEPLAYILGQQEFWGLAFEVSAEVLIPRPETELLVELALKHCPDGARVHDLGTGSGAIAIAVSHERPDLKVSASDRSPASLALSRANAQRHSADVTFQHSDWFADLAGPFDCIVSNPPYIAHTDPHLPALRYEPNAALVSGIDGMAALTHIVQRAKKYLKQGGALMLEHGFEQGERVMALMQDCNYREVRAHQDLAGHHRVTTAQTAG